MFPCIVDTHHDEETSVNKKATWPVSFCFVMDVTKVWDKKHICFSLDASPHDLR